MEEHNSIEENEIYCLNILNRRRKFLNGVFLMKDDFLFPAEITQVSQNRNTDETDQTGLNGYLSVSIR